ncbi:MAG: hypothetical protein EOO10_19475 [Chitinophagaceae bacterium]|nr:MAG: hypothetical protein EOO10_19475 [Chitinophagaceae bacterium]
MKKYLLVAAMLLSTGVFFAFTPTESNQKTKSLDQQWYIFNGGDENLPENYSLKPSQEAPTCTVGEDMCAVKAVPHPTEAGQPDLSDENILIRREN